mgnify:CR=1 FL=1
MNQEPRRYTRADYRRAVRRRRIKARVGIVSTAAAVLLLVIGAGVLIVNRLLPGITGKCPDVGCSGAGREEQRRRRRISQNRRDRFYSVEPGMPLEFNRCEC